ncbi:MAG: hypothetical protein OCD76_00725 [Reichenbachiella sp.]
MSNSKNKTKNNIKKKTKAKPITNKKDQVDNDSEEIGIPNVDFKRVMGCGG